MQALESPGVDVRRQALEPVAVYLRPSRPPRDLPQQPGAFEERPTEHRRAYPGPRIEGRYLGVVVAHGVPSVAQVRWVRNPENDVGRPPLPQ